MEWRPHIGSSHSSQNFKTLNGGHTFNELDIFVSGPDILDQDSALTDEQKMGLFSGIAFTEIDHIYLDFISKNYQTLINSIFSKRGTWTSPEGDPRFIISPISVFNEYMTQALFCLYILDNYESSTADFIIKKWESIMVDRRKYLKFREFNKILLVLYKQNKGPGIIPVFPQILQWCNTQI